MDKENVKPTKKQSLLNCIYEEVVRGSAISDDDSNYLIKEQRIITFLSIPWELEKVLYLGYLVCLDAFLFLFTFLPIRTICATVKTLFWLLRKFLFLQTPPIDKGHICDLFRVGIMLSCLYTLSWVNISMLYHLIRGQSVIKLYFIYNVLEIMDYLCLSFGSDVMEALFWLTIRHKRKKREHLGVLWHWVLACIYTLFHSLSFLIQAICLSVAINSHNKSLMVVMTSNQFMELKSYLFKKFDYINNYQIVARDIRERFSYTVVLIMVFIRNMSQLDWDTSHMWDIFPDVAAIVCSEIAIDWIKHAFVTKFNGIPVETYVDYRYQLYDDLLNPKQFRQTFSNRMDSMARKILFIPMPLACLTVTVLIEVMPDDWNLEPLDWLKYGGITMTVLFIVKVINMGLILHNAEVLRKARPVYSTPVIPPIRNVNSSVKLPTFKSSPDITDTSTTPSLRSPDITPSPDLSRDHLSRDHLHVTMSDPMRNSLSDHPRSSLSTIAESESGETSPNLKSSRSAPDLCNSPEVYYRNNHSPESSISITPLDSPVSTERSHTPDKSITEDSKSTVSIEDKSMDRKSSSPDDIENEPPRCNNENLRGEEDGNGLRRRTNVNNIVEE